MYELYLTGVIFIDFNILLGSALHLQMASLINNVLKIPSTLRYLTRRYLILSIILYDYFQKLTLVSHKDLGTVFIFIFVHCYQFSFSHSFA